MDYKNNISLVFNLFVCFAQDSRERKKLKVQDTIFIRIFA